MTLVYQSTRDEKNRVTASQAILTTSPLGVSLSLANNSIPTSMRMTIRKTAMPVMTISEIFIVAKNILCRFYKLEVYS